MRRRDILSDDEAVIEFYDARIPRAITDVRGFERWWKDTRAETPALLTMTRADLLEEDDDVVARDPDAFPDRLHGFALTLPLRDRARPTTASPSRSPSSVSPPSTRSRSSGSCRVCAKNS